MYYKTVRQSVICSKGFLYTKLTANYKIIQKEHYTSQFLTTTTRFYSYFEKRQAMPVLIHSARRGKNPAVIFPSALLVEGSAPKPP